MRYPIIIILCLTILMPFAGTGSAASNPSTTLYPRLTGPAEDAGAAVSETDQNEAGAQRYAQLFRDAYDRFERGRYEQACQRFYQFLSEKSPDDTDYEWAEFFFGVGMKRLGYSQAAVDTLTTLLTRKPNTKIAAYILEMLEQISRSGAFDRDLVVTRGICDQNYGFVEGNLADFVHYYQGEYDWEHGLFQWGDKHFARIQPDSFYHNKYLFKQALRAYYDRRIDASIRMLKQILIKLADGDPLKDDVRKTLARLYYEVGKFSEADFLYEQIEMNIVDQAQSLMERAWVHYRLGNPERAMGLLYSFEAPSYVNSFTPEFYIIKSFIYKDVCHYKKAMQVLDQFKGRYGSALDKIYHRRPVQDNNAMLLVILNKPKIRRLWSFLELLEREHQMSHKLPDNELRAYLDKLYRLKRDEIELKFRNLVTDEYEKMANAMLRFEEESHLMEYEIGIDMYQRVQTYHYAESDEQPESGKTTNGKVVYAFQGEFWNDELDHYEVTLPNKCKNAEEWDIFFK
jgi:tetratricopeptide (TPR) repeat protein